MKQLAILLASLLLTGQLYAQSNPAFDFQDPSDSHSAGTIDGTTDEINMVGGYREAGSDILSNDISGNSATSSGTATTPTVCGAGNSARGIDTSFDASGCFDVTTEAELTTHTGNASAHHAPTVDTNADTICSGTDVYLDGEGNCDNILGGGSLSGWVLESSTTFTGVGSVSVPLTSVSSATFQVIFTAFLYGGTNTHTYLRPNADGNAVYETVTTGETTNGATPGADSGSGATRCYCNRSADQDMDDSAMFCEYKFYVFPNDNTKMIGAGKGMTRISGPTSTAGDFIKHETGCFYDGASAISSLEAETANGTMDGSLQVYRAQ